jgi:hypothetical protein
MPKKGPQSADPQIYTARPKDGPQSSDPTTEEKKNNPTTVAQSSRSQVQRPKTCHQSTKRGSHRKDEAPYRSSSRGIVPPIMTITIVTTMPDQSARTTSRPRASGQDLQILYTPIINISQRVPLRAFMKSYAFYVYIKLYYYLLVFVVFYYYFYY